MTPGASVIIPAFNRRAMLLEAIESVFAQRESQFELIVVDDGSTDDTADAVDHLMPRAPVPMQIIRTENRGAAAARNAGVRLATAPMVAFLDSDDLWAPEKLARQLAWMRDHPECEISQCNEWWIRDGRRVNPGRRHLKRGGDIFVDSLRTCLISPSAVIMRRDLFNRSGGFDETMAAAEDYDLWLRLLLDHEVGLIDETLVTRRAGHPGQLSATVPAIDRFRILALAKLLADPRLTGEKRRATATVLAEKCTIYTNGLRRRGQDDRAEFYEDIARRSLRIWIRQPDDSIEQAVREIRQLNCRTVTDSEQEDGEEPGQVRDARTRR